MKTFTNANGTFEQLAEGKYLITSGGANMWQGTNEYSTVYREQGADENWSATVRINSQGNSNGSAKAGIIVRNDVTQVGSSPGYAALGMRPSGGFEWLRGNAAGQLATSSAASSTSYPAWVRIVRDGDLYTASWSKDGENFTQIGEPQALPGAASVQDVGLFVTAHSTSATSAVEFQDFVFDDDPQTGDPARRPAAVPRAGVGRVRRRHPRPAVDRRPPGRRQADHRRRRPRRPAGRAGRHQRGRDRADQLPRSGRTRRGLDARDEARRPARPALAARRPPGPRDRRRVHQARVHEEPERQPVPRVPDRDRWRPHVARPDERRRGLPSTIHLRLVSDGSAITAAYSADGQTWTALAGSAP